MPDSSPTQRQLLDAAGVNRCLDEIAEAIYERWKDEEKLALVGVYRRGVPFAEALGARLIAKGLQIELGKIDITQYRDDLHSFTVLPKLEGSEIDFDLDDAVVILCDEVVYTARTSRAALEELLGFGRPRMVQIAALVDRAGRELPFTADFAGLKVDLPKEDRVRVRFAAMDGRDEVFVTAWHNKTA
ncbi:bifunctional pyr operon transcriptional regulator/uracil phosphoribosyltransferase PyrR [Brevifollis gellanilyticus]|uniref:bifunctional pyr operon transcriptional regulator/uracil phosphoribosyltransferase PyrR n=1 Tax=Brevifollis gellanilyticus TaxID=748831 RepID=UPI0014780CAF|nr:bifunctional pyr operon transcriptional regulator/uracil phosphoribosyltransferase PyrR [Brevifollis gellanilyticus]